MTRNFSKKSLVLSLLFLGLLVSGCTGPVAGAEVPQAERSGQPTAAADTRQISLTPTPAFTATADFTATATPTATLTPTPMPAVLIGAGDIAYCGDAPEYQTDERTAELIADLIEKNPGAMVFAAGDVVYSEGRLIEYQNCFGPSWGRFKERLRPVPGNHDYMTEGGAPYYAYFGEAAGLAGLGYYSYDLGDWHIIGLNSNCNDIACGPNSDQVAWLREDLQNNSRKCTLAYWHHPRFSSGLAGGSGVVNPFWRTAVELGVDVVVNGHDHNYERFAPMNTEGAADSQGTRMFVAGTGGAMLRAFGTPQPNSEVRYNGAHGVLQFKLYPDHYEWTFFPVEDMALTDTGTGYCR